jgi:hypothetical protein
VTSIIAPLATEPPRSFRPTDSAAGNVVHVLSVHWAGATFTREAHLGWIVRAAEQRLSLVVVVSDGRLELYSTARDRSRAFRPVLEALRARVNAEPSLGEARVVEKGGTDAACHLLRRAAGLGTDAAADKHFAMQLHAATAMASVASSLGPSLTSLFRAAANTSRRVRQETALGQAMTSALREVELLAAERIAEEELLAWQSQEAECFRATEQAWLYCEVEQQNHRAAQEADLVALGEGGRLSSSGRNSFFGEEPGSAVRLRVSEPVGLLRELKLA